jgi:hypothetical protein
MATQVNLGSTAGGLEGSGGIQLTRSTHESRMLTYALGQTKVSQKNVRGECLRSKEKILRLMISS